MQVFKNQQFDLFGAVKTFDTIIKVFQMTSPSNIIILKENLRLMSYIMLFKLDLQIRTAAGES